MIKRVSYGASSNNNGVGSFNARGTALRRARPGGGWQLQVCLGGDPAGSGEARSRGHPRLSLRTAIWLARGLARVWLVTHGAGTRCPRQGEAWKFGGGPRVLVRLAFGGTSHPRGAHEAGYPERTEGTAGCLTGPSHRAIPTHSHPWLVLGLADELG